MTVFRRGRSYLWLFFVLGALSLGGNAICFAYGYPRWGSAILPAIIALITVSELISGVALDSWWRASLPRGTEGYWLALVIQSSIAAATVVFVVI